jgi:membrane-associated phospholipid phosphatase
LPGSDFLISGIILLLCSLIFSTQKILNFNCVLTEIYRNNKAFLLPYFIFLLMGIPLFIAFPKSEIHLFLNNYNCKSGDFFFKYLTYLGSGLSPVIVALPFLLISVRKSLFVAAAPSLAGLLAQLLKLFIFPDVSRPLEYLKGIANLHLVDGVRMYHSYSFPSGHSATVFALCFSLAIQIKNIPLKLVLFLVALLVGYSRVYLSQHFLNDIYAGSIVGMVSVPVMYSLMNRIKGKWADKSLLHIFKTTIV